MLKPVLTTTEQHLVIRTMGRLSAADAKALRELMAQPTEPPKQSIGFATPEDKGKKPIASKGKA